MSAGGQAALAAASPHASAGVEQFAGLTYTLLSIAALFAFARWIECRNGADPNAARAAAPQPFLRAWRALRSSSSH